MMKRSAGILLPISSLPSKYGIGCFSKTAYDFVDWLKEAGQTLWQILPICPTGYGDSPYQSFSTYAGNPYFISLEKLIEEGVLTQEEVDAQDFGSQADSVDYGKIYNARYPLLRKAYERSDISRSEDYQAFVKDNAWWLSDYALFMALKNFFTGKNWTQWPEDIRLRWGYALDYYRKELYFEIEFQQYMQFKVFEQYKALKKYANSQGIKILGDVPIYVSMDSADIWAHPELFQLDEKNVPLAVAGCPPDGFSATGQLWGNPLYRWDYHRQTGYQWWITRLWYAYQLYDVTRIDHFRGFDEYYSIPFGAESAIGGHWEKGPGMELFNAVEAALGKHEVIAEDLGYMTPSVRQLVKDSGFPGMKVLQFAFDLNDEGAANDYLPHNYPENSIAYTGTHDNETMTGWFAGRSKQEIQLIRDYIFDQHTPRKYLPKAFIAMALRSVSRLCVIPIQDYLGLDNSARINKPAVLGSNWNWRMKPDALTPELQKEIAELTRRYGRFNYPEKKPEEALKEAASEAAEAAEAVAEPAEETK